LDPIYQLPCRQALLDANDDELRKRRRVREWRRVLPSHEDLRHPRGDVHAYATVQLN
jgi:hypothetical protein